jgi:SnoaL-like domain
MAERFDAWVRAYEAAWRAGGTGALNDLFTADATYQAAPFDDPVVGLDAIARFWEAEREGPDEAFELSWEIIAAQDDTPSPGPRSSTTVPRRAPTGTSGSSR